MKTVAIVGTGPSALMAAEVVSGAGHRVELYEKRKGPGRKLLIAGSSGLNITNSLARDTFIDHFSGPPKEFWQRVLRSFSPEQWLKFVQKELGIPTFEGSSGRYFVEDMKASRLLLSWVKRLNERNVQLFQDTECVDFSGRELHFSTGAKKAFDAVCFCLGGGSYEADEVPLRWPAIFKNKHLGFDEFTASNAGFQIAWPEAFLKEAEGLPLKSIVMSSSKGKRQGDAVITSYGIEGTPVYFVGEVGTVSVDLKPDLTSEQILLRCRDIKENLSPLRRIKKKLSLCDAANALLFHLVPDPARENLSQLIGLIKAFPLPFLSSQPLAEAISSAGGLHLSELDDQFMLKKFPGVFAAGEMLSWDVPTGGFLIQACVSQGYSAGQGVVNFLRSGGIKNIAQSNVATIQVTDA